MSVSLHRLNILQKDIFLLYSVVSPVFETNPSISKFNTHTQCCARAELQWFARFNFAKHLFLTLSSTALHWYLETGLVGAFPPHKSANTISQGLLSGIVVKHLLVYLYMTENKKR